MEDKVLLTKEEIMIRLINHFTREICKAELDIEVFKSDIFEEKHKEQSKDIAEKMKVKHGRELELKRMLKIKGIAEQLLIQYKDKGDKKN